MKYYFTFGNSEQFPFQDTYLTIEAESEKAAIQEFRIHFPDFHEDTVNCSFIYDELNWPESNEKHYGAPVMELSAPISCYAVVIQQDCFNQFSIYSLLTPIYLRPEETEIEEYKGGYSYYTRCSFSTREEAQKEVEFLSGFDFSVKREWSNNQNQIIKVCANDSVIETYVASEKDSYPDIHYLSNMLWTPFVGDYNKNRKLLSELLQDSLSNTQTQAYL